MRTFVLLVLSGCSVPSTSQPGHATSDTGAWTDEDGDGYEGDADTDADTDADGDADTGTDATDSGALDTGDTAEDPPCDDATPVTLFLSPDDSNSMSSPAQVRDAVLGGWNDLQSVPIRTWEFFNYYQFAYPPADEGIRVTPQMAREDDGTYVLQVGLSSTAVSVEDREPLDLVLVLDTSGSMGGTSIGLLQETVRAIASSLRAGDIVSMVEWDTDNAIDLEDYEVTGANDPVLLAAVDGLEVGGGTNLNAGLTAGYDIAARDYDPTRINRVVLISDGGANVGVTDTDLIASHAGAADQEGIYLVGVGVGTADSYHDTLMDSVTDVGRGASVFVGSVAEAWKQFGPDGFEQVMDVAERDVSVQLDLPPGFAIQRFSGEAFSTNRADIPPQHLAPNDTMVFYQTLVTCAPELVTDDTTIGVTVTYTDPITFEVRTRSTTATFGDLLAADRHLLDKGAAVYAYADALKLAQHSSMEAWPAIFDAALERVAVAEASNPGDTDLAEIRQVLEGLGG